MAIIEEIWMEELRKGKKGAKLTIIPDSLRLQVTIVIRRNFSLFPYTGVVLFHVKWFIR